MMRIKYLFGVLALIIVLLPLQLLVFLPVPVKAATSIRTFTPMAKAEPVSGPVGTEVTVSGVGFRTSEDGITITYDGEIIKCNIVADSVGSWKTTVEIPPSTKGRHKIGIYGSDFTPIGVVRDSYFDVIPQINLVPQMYFEPISKKTSTKLTVAGTGFAKGESVSISFDAIKLAAAVVDCSGSFSAILGVPQVKSSKEYVIAVAGSSGSSAQANFFTEVEKSQTPAPQLLSPVQGVRLEIFDSLVDVIFGPARYLTGVFDYLRGSRQKSLKPGLVTFVWTNTAESSNASYVLQIARTYDFSSPVLVKAGLSSSSYTLSRDDVLIPGVYNWRVKTVDDLGEESEWSESWKFEVIYISDQVLTIYVVSLLLLIGTLVIRLLTYK